MITYGKEIGIAVWAVRARDFTSRSDIEVKTNHLTVLIGAKIAGKTSFHGAMVAAIGAGRRT